MLLAFLAGVLAMLWSITGRAERQLVGAFASMRDSEASYRRQFADSSVVMLLIDLVDGAILQANDAAVRFYGYGRDRLETLRISEISTHPAAEVREALASVLSGQVQRFEARHRLADGSIRDVQLSASLIRFRESQVLHAIIHDVTERREAERDLRAREAELREAQRIGRTGSWIAETAADAPVWSGEMYRVFGLEAETGPLDADLVSELLAPESGDAIREAFGVALAGGGPFELEVEFIRPDGSRGWVLLRGAPDQSSPGEAGGVTQGLHGTVTDISEVRQSRDALEASEARFRALFDGSRDALLILAPPAWTFASGNPAAHELFGIPHAQDMATLSPGDLSPERQPDGTPSSDMLRAQIDLALRDGSNFFEWTHRRLSGEAFPATVLLTRVEIAGQTVLQATVRDITAEKRAKDELRASEENFRTFVESTADLILVAAPDGRIVFANAAVGRTLGYAHDDLLGKPLADMFPEDERLQAREAMDALLGGETASAALSMATRDGGLVSLETRARIGPWNGVACAFVVARDLTAQKRAEALVRTQAATLGGVLESTQHPIFSVDRDCRYTSFNVSHAAVMRAQYGTEIAIGASMLECMTVESDRSRAAADHERVMAGEAFSFEVLVGERARRQTWLQVSHSPIRDTEGTVIGVATFNLDITERKTAEDALRTSELSMRAITDSTQDAIVMMDPGGRVSFWNPGAERMFGYASAEVIGLDLHDLFAPARFQEAFRAAYPAFLLTGQGDAVGRLVDLDGVRRDGTEFPVQVSLSSVNLDGSWYAVGVLRDSTERKAAERDLWTANSALEGAVVRANEMAARAEVANQAKGEFLANMSHEIRTPMNGVIGMTGLLLDTPLDASQRRYAETVRASGESLLALISDILDFSKIEAGKLDLEYLDFDLHTMLDDVASALAFRAHGKGLEFICSAAPDVPAFLSGDPGRLRQVLLNLAGNALKFTHEGEVAVRVTLDAESETGVVLRFSVRDTGIGIPVSKQGLLFQKFSQADASTTRRFGGTGLGLAISKQLVELMGGEIGLASEAGRGSEFWFTARLGRLAGRPDAALPLGSIRGTRILIVDDNATNREVLATQLTAWGVRAHEVPGGLEALDALRRARDEGDPFVGAILDMQMPGMDGADLARAIKADLALADTRLILLTSFGQRGDAQEMHQIGFAAYLLKPTRQSDLFDALVTVIGGGSKAGFPVGDPAADPAGDPDAPILTRHVIGEMRRGAARVLLAEDNVTNQQVALGILTKLGVRADAVANGAEAVRALETLPYDVVLMDVQMPEMDGFEATRRIRDPRSAVLDHGIPVIAMTAHALKGDRERCLEAGMNDYVTKPISPEAVAAALARWLPEQAPTRPIPEPVVAMPAAGVGIASEPGGVVFDRTGMLARLMGDEDLARDVAKGFVADIPRQIQLLRTSLDAGEIGAVVGRAHQIKGAAANVGAEALRAVAAEMEEAGRTGDATPVAVLLPVLEERFTELRRAMAELVGDPGPADPGPADEEQQL
jgi:PAS domain S-box-containing protein